MDLLKNPPEFDLTDPRWKIYARSPVMPPHFIGGSAVVEQSLIAEGCEVHGTVKGSVLFAGVNIESNAIVEDSGKAPEPGPGDPDSPQTNVPAYFFPAVIGAVLFAGAAIVCVRKATKKNAA